MRGEHGLRSSDVASGSGSAPRARGTLRTDSADEPAGRISPACAGNTARGAGAGTCWPDQPRVRGEHAVPTSVRRCLTGSAPRARGTLRQPGQSESPGRISPACAGNTIQSLFKGVLMADQPRVRGEHKASLFRLTPEGGSAPRARGTLPQRGAHRITRRISPACAGNTRRASARSTKRTDQPRVRGEHNHGTAFPTTTHGSAPRARGTP